MEKLLEQAKALPVDDQKVFFRKFIESMTVGNIIPLVKELEEAWDVEAVPQIPDWMNQGPQEEEEKEQTQFDVIVTDCGPKRITTVKAARQASGMLLRDVNALLKGLPATLLTKVSREVAEDAKKQLEEAGGTVEIR